MRDEPAAFEREHKARRRLVPPAAHHFQRRQAIKRRVDFDSRELCGVELKLPFCRHVLEIEMCLPFLVNPAARADVDPIHALTFKVIAAMKTNREGMTRFEAPSVQDPSSREIPISKLQIPVRFGL